ncbi:unnamed protein product [Strongylus vulgaris]|uniref:Amino acid transporter transmembrane domain-containing protein n=1 Tax=Strongylus vulgaris TaxID=40348 RepID=A0A3P7IUU4_STRVU|nr:unnamed protein product [Strongylus vulgaris]
MSSKGTIERPPMIRSSYAFINLVKAMCGVGVFALPVAFQQSGLWTGVLLTFGLGFVNAHTMVKIVRCSQYLSRIKRDKGRTVEPLATLTRRTDPSKLSSLAVFMHLLAVNACIMGLQVGICSAYYIFVVDHSKEVIDYTFSLDIRRHLLFFGILPFFILLATVRSLVILSWIGLAGNVLVTAAVININVALAMENRMRQPQDMLGPFGVISTSALFVSVLYAATGFLGFATYGERLKGSITLNLTNSP